MVLPHVPPDFPLPEPEQHNETYEGLSRDYRRIGTLGLRQYTWESIFPVGRRYPFMPPEASDNGWDYVAFFQRGRERKIPFRMIVLDSGGACRLNTPGHGRCARPQRAGAMGTLRTASAAPSTGLSCKGGTAWHRSMQTSIV